MSARSGPLPVRTLVFLAAACFVIAGLALILEVRRLGPESAGAIKSLEPAFARVVSMLRSPWVAVVPAYSSKV